VSSATSKHHLDDATPETAQALAWLAGGSEDDTIVMDTGGEVNLFDRLQGVPWFAACTGEQLEAVVRLAERLHIDEGEVILREGRLGRELFVILEGSVVVTRAGRVVNEWGPGDYFGELAAIEGMPRSATVTAATNLEVLIVGPREFDAMMDIPGVRNALLVGMARRIREADDKLAAYAESGAEADRRTQ
jgi:CRP-like cAMP-binding protein